MELWLLGAGAIVLIAITLWIVWPARTADTADASVRDEEVSNNTMTASNGPVMPPQGDRFEDQYTSATGDLSAGGIATAVEGMHDEGSPVTPYPTPASTMPGQPSVSATSRTGAWPEADASGERIGQASRSDTFPYETPSTDNGLLARPKKIGMGAGAVLALGGAVGGAWLYARWQRERNKPINRLRRGARDVASRLGDRLPDVVDDLPRGAAPMSGLATALLLSGLMLSRVMRHDSDDDRTEAVRGQATDIVRDSLREALGFGRDAMDRGRSAIDSGREYSDRIPVDKLKSRFDGMEPRKPAMFMGLGFGGLALVGGGAYMVWRLLRGSEPRPQQPWYTGQ
jgi:hypothetical protein